METFFIKQIETLTEENKILNLKIQSLLESSSINNANNANNDTSNKDIMLNTKVNAPNYEDWIKTFDKYLTFNDIRYDTRNFVDASLFAITKLFLDGNDFCIYTYNKKKKIMAIKRNSNWEKIQFIEFMEITKKITDNCIKVFHRYMQQEKKKNKFDETFEERYSHIIVCMFEEIDKHKETIANKLIELLVMI